MSTIEQAPLRADQKLRDLIDRLLGSGQANASQRLCAQGLQALKTQGQMAAALAAGHRMNLIDDHGAYIRKHGAARIRAEQHVE